MSTKKKPIPGTTDVVTLRPTTFKSILVTGLFYGIAMLAIIQSIIQVPSSIFSWLLTILAVCVGLFFLYLAFNQTIGFLRVDDYGLTALQSWSNGTTKKDIDRFILPRLKTIAFKDIAKAAILSAPYGNGTIPVLAIRSTDQKEQILRIGAYPENDLLRLVKHLREHNIKVEVEQDLLAED